MEAFYDRSILGEIEFYEMSGEHEKSTELKKQFKARKAHNKDKLSNGEFIRHNPPRKHVVLEGVVVASGWDENGRVTRACLYTQSGDDIILVHRLGIKKFKPFINDKVRISGDEGLEARDGRKVFVKRISREFGRKLLLLPAESSQREMQTGG